MQNKQRAGQGLPSLVGSNDPSSSITPQHGANRNQGRNGLLQSSQKESAQSHVSGQYTMQQQRAQQQRPPRAKVDVQLNPRLQGRPQPGELAIGQTVNQEMRPNTTKYKAGRTINGQDIEGKYLQRTGQSIAMQPQSRQRGQFQTVDAMAEPTGSSAFNTFGRQAQISTQVIQAPMASQIGRRAGKSHQQEPEVMGQRKQQQSRNAQAKAASTHQAASRVTTAGTGSRFRVAVPMHSSVAQQRMASNSFWNQVSKTINQTQKLSSAGGKRPAREQHATVQVGQTDQPVSSEAGASDARDDQEFAASEMQKRIRQYQDTLTGKIKDQNQQAKKFAFLTNVGGKDTTQAGVTLRTGPGPNAGPVLSATSALLISSAKGGKAAAMRTLAEGQSEKSTEQMQIFTDMNVDKFNQNARTMPRQRVVYLNSSASNKNLPMGQAKMANSKSGANLDSFRHQHTASNKHLLKTTSIDSFQRRPVSGMSKDGSQSRLRPSQLAMQANDARQSTDIGQFQPNFQHGAGQGSARPGSRTGAQQPFADSAHPFTQEEFLDDGYLDYQNIDEMDEEQNISQNEGQVGNFCQQLMDARPTTALVGSQEPDDQLPYPELFDRSERTFAATFARYGDLSYFTPVQRIGTYMEYQARLKKRHLMDLIAYIKTSQCQIKLDDENDANMGLQNAQDFKDHCLFSGLMPEQDDTEPETGEIVTDLPNVTYANQRPLPKIKSYNPCSAKAMVGFDFGKIWSDKLLKQVDISIKRMLHYIENPDSIRNDELSKYKKEWMKNALDLVPDQYLSNFPVEVKLLFHDVFQSYVRAMKQAIMEYILRSPDERKRLHILTLPHVVLTAAQRQARYGGYSVQEYAGTHLRKTQAETEVKFRLITYNIVVSQLTNWWQEFRKFKLVDLQNLRQVVKERDLERDNQEGGQPNAAGTASPSMALDIDNFLGFQEAMLEKTVALMKHVWHRGAITIIKKFKMLRSKQQQKELVTGNAARSKWTYAGYQTYPADYGFAFDSDSYDKLEKQLDEVKDFTYRGGSDESTRMDVYQEYCLRTASAHQNVLLRFFRVESSSKHDAVIDDYMENTQLADLVDVRESDAYMAFVSMVGGFTNYEENGYGILSKEYKRELKYAAGNLMAIQLRQMVDDSVTTLANFFKGFKTFSELKQKMPNFAPLRRQEQDPHNYEPVGMKNREDGRNGRGQAQSASDVGMNRRLAEQLRKRQSDQESTAHANRQKRMFSNAVTDQPKLNWPDYMDLQDYVNPIFHLELLLAAQQDGPDEQAQTSRRSHHFDETLEFNKSDEQILHHFENYFEDLVHCFNEMSRPEFCKIQEYGKQKYEVDLKELEASRKVSLDYQRENKKSNKSRNTDNKELQDAVKKGLFKFKNSSVINPKPLNFDKMLYSKDFEASYSYERYMGRIKVKEAPADVGRKQLVDQESPPDTVFQRDAVDRTMKVASTSEEFFKGHRRDILKVLREHLHEVKRVRELFDQFKPIYKSEMQSRVRLFINRPENSLDLMQEYSTFLNELRRYRALARELPERVAFPLFEVGTNLVKEEVQSRINKYITAILWKFECDLKVRAKTICENFEEIRTYYKRELTSAEDVVEMERYKNNLQSDMSHLQRNLAATRKCLLFLVCQTDYSEILMETAPEAGSQDGECIKFVDEMLAWPQKLNEYCESADERHLAEKTQVELRVLDKYRTFLQKVAELSQNLAEVHKWTNLNSYKHIMGTVVGFHDEVDALEKLKQEISHEEGLLNMAPRSDFRDFQKEVRFFEPYFEMWTRIDDMMTKKNTWASSKLSEIDADEVAQTHKESIRSLQKLQKDFGSAPGVANILRSLQREIQELDGWRPTVDALCNRALQPRHWSKIKEVSGMSAEEVNFETATLWQVLDLKVSDVLPKLAEISENAKKESRLEEMLRSMKREWDEMRFEITEFRETQIPILSGNKVEEMQTKLDEDVLVSQTIKNSPAVLPLLEEARSWERTMLFTQETIEIWLRVQTSYLYLWPIFNSVGIQDEVKSLLDSEGFATVDKAWRNIMGKLQEDTLALSLSKIDDLDTILKECNFQLENIQKNLNEYLEAKRRFFSRFFFLSNEDLIEILGDSQKPRSIQKHLKKCFEGINKVTFRALNASDATELPRDEITCLVSKEGEKVQLIRTIQPHDYDGKVEEWLYDLEQSMKSSIQGVISEGLRDFPAATVEEGADHLSVSTSDLYAARVRWLKVWPSQVILTVSQIIWTRQVEESLNSYSMIVKLHQQSQAQLNQIVNLVREKMPELLRLTLSSLIVQNVHSRDLVEQLARKRVTDLEDFEWISQLRYYYIADTQAVAVRMITTELWYCNEFLGNTGRLVITQLTDRCYRTLMSALQLNLGGAPEGPAGTGKTETTKDLAKAVGVYCIVFNCADGLNARAMAKFFKGLASGGCWSCFDEFNRIELEVLSVIAQQVLEIQRAKNLGQRKFVFEGATISLQPTANIFITMNPGYAGRSVLPDNLKALFRPVAMMVPEYVSIAEISLYSYGFFESRSLAKKIVSTYRLCSEQLSTQDHYDYGMRAVKSVLTAAKNLKFEATRKAAGLPSRLSRDSSHADGSSLSKDYNATEHSGEEPEDILILKSIQDVNLPKFLAPDILLFEGIISDLFPGVELPPPYYQDLQRCAKKVLSRLNLQNANKCMEKLIQLYDMIKCRHGLMLVGPASSGKTTTYRVLAEALTLVCSASPSFAEKEVETYVINPKSITQAQLYGNYDAISQEFTDGVLGSIFRFCSYVKPNVKRRWIVFDGPVDAKWIENMNTVLDDNKRLCLMNSEIIQMTDSMNMLFETHDLSKASPATISRCGMVYMAEDSYGGPRTLLKSWLNTFATKANLAQLTVVEPGYLPERMERLFEHYFVELMDRVKKTCQFVLPASENEITASMLRIMTILTHQETFRERIHDPAVKDSEITQRFDMIFQYAMMWSLGAVVSDASHREFFLRLREKVCSQVRIGKSQFRIERTYQIPDQGQAPTNFYVEDLLWISWRDVLSRQEGRPPSEDQDASEIIVPTTEILKQKYLLSMFAGNGKPVLFVGPTGTGKTVAISQYLREVDRDKFDALTICFSAKSSANFTQKQIEDRLDRKKRRHLGPANGKRLLVFIDDMNMPTVEAEGAQPPIELLRQWMDHKQWYDHSDKGNQLQKISDIVIIGAMCPPAGGKNPVTPRFSRHFNIVACPAFDRHVMSRIYCTIIDSHIRKEGLRGLDTAKTLKKVVDAAIDVFMFAKDNLRPTPAKSHYLFNLRDVSRVVAGIQMMKTFVHGSKQKLVRLWVHECGRVFSDRLNDEADSRLLFEQLYASCRDFLKEDLYTCLKAAVPDRLLAEDPAYNRSPVMMQSGVKFSDLLDPAKGSQNRGYDELDVAAGDALAKSLAESLEAHNAVSQRPMDLVLFDYAVVHLLRICRILKMHKGNALLIGVGGSGRQSLSFLAAFLMEQVILQPEQSKSYAYEQWAEDMKKLLQLAGCDLKKCAFLLTDNQLKAGFMLEDVNNLINQYEIPGLFGADDKILMAEKVRLNAKKEGNLDLYNNGTPEAVLDFFITKVQKNLHIILAMSPTGNTLGERIRNFPSLVNCCTLDWFHKWPVQALNAVAMKRMEETPFDEDLKAKIVSACETFHLEAAELSKRYLLETGRHNYVTPTSFLDLMRAFQALLDKQRTYLYEKQQSYAAGIEKLQEQKQEVTEMQQAISDDQPRLEELQVSTAHKRRELQETAETEVEPRKRLIQEEEEKANSVAMKAQECKIVCENELAKAWPILKAADDALHTIKPAHINEIRVLQHPPKHVKMVLHAVCVMCDRKVERTPKKENPKQLEDNWWYTAQKFMGERDFMSQLENYDKGNIPPAIMQRINAQFLEDPEFRPKRVEKASHAAKGLCEWIIKLKEYDKIVKFIKPKKLDLRNAQARYQARMQDLQAKQADLKEVEVEYKRLQDALHKAQDTQEGLLNKISSCKVKLGRATQLLSGLGGERERWQVSLEDTERKLTTIVPDVLLAAASIAYLGAFTAKYRKQAVDSWLYQMHIDSLQTLENYSLERVLGEPVHIRRWQLHGLPKDSFSVENGLMMNSGHKWPLMIDPQGQANRWIKNMEMQDQAQGTRLMILKPADADTFSQRFEQALRMGLAVLLESVGEELDPILDPVLLKQVFKVGGVRQIKFADSNIDYADEFRLYLTTRQTNPHYLPETAAKVQIINFMITFEGLSEQLLNLVVCKENEQLDSEHQRLIVTQYENHKKMRDTEATILKVLKEAKKNILEDENAINILDASQRLSEEIARRQAEADATEQRLSAALQAFKPIAVHSAMLFFLVSKLHMVDVMYQYSLSWFIQLFSQAVDRSRDVQANEEEGEQEEESKQSQSNRPQVGKRLRCGAVVSANVEGRGLSIEALSLKNRVAGLINYFTQSLYSNVCRSIFEKDKLLFSFLLTAKIRESQSKLSSEQYQLLAETMTGLENPLSNLENPCPDWLPNTIWNKLCTYAQRDSFFDPLVKNFARNAAGWRQLYECEIFTDDLFPPNETNISRTWSPFMKLLILKAVRPDKLGQAVQQYVHQEMGQEFLTPPIFDIEKSFEDSTSGTPLIFILPGSDPLQQLNAFAMQKKKYESMKSISLGQNQGPIADKAIAAARKAGWWVLLQNCHLYPSWMPRLEQICEQMEGRGHGRGETSHSSFRLWLTSYPSENFPATVLQGGIKLTNEPPIGLKSNMLGSYKTDPLADPDFFSSNSSSAHFKKIAFGLTMFHAILLQRCNYGPLGWNQNHRFTVSDLQISMRQLHYFIDQYEQVPFNALKYLVGQCNYGGRVTESADQRVLMALLEDFLSEKVLEPDYAYCDDEKVGSLYTFPQGDDGYHVHIDKINSMPTDELPQIFGFHPNADISKNQAQAQNLCGILLQIGDVEGAAQADQEDESSGDMQMRVRRVQTIMSRATESQKRPEDDLLGSICSDIAQNLPDALVDMEQVTSIFRIERGNSMNTVLIHELGRFNVLLSQILTTLADLDGAQKGEILMTERLSTTRLQLLQGYVPDSWLAVSYPTMKPLASYVRNLNLRIKTLQKWVDDEEPPEVFWLPGFFFTNSFLTAILQDYSRSHRVEIDALQFSFDFINKEDPTDHEQEIYDKRTARQRGLSVTVPTDGALVSGMYFEGCRWDYDLQCIAEQAPKQLFSTVPIILLQPTEHRPGSPQSLRTKGTNMDAASASTRRARNIQDRRNIRSEALRSGQASESAEQHEGNSRSVGPEKAGRDSAGLMQAVDPEGTLDQGEALYECPLYRTTARCGTLATTGHSTNFIMMVSTPLPTDVGDGGEVHPQGRAAVERTTSNHWIKRGAAMICSLPY